MNFVDDFAEWLTNIEPELTKVYALLSKRLSQEPEELIGDLEDAEAWNGRVGGLLAEANSYLDKGRFFFLSSIDKEQRALDKEVELDNCVSNVRTISRFLD